MSLLTWYPCGLCITTSVLSKPSALLFRKTFLPKNVMNRGEQDISKAKGIVIRKIPYAVKRSYVSKHFFILW